MPIEYRILVEIASTGQGDETQGSTGDNLLGAFATDEAGEQGGVVGTSDSAFVCWLITALCSPSQGLVHSCAAPKDVVAGVLKGLVSSCLRAVMSLPMSLKASMLRSLAIVVRGLDVQTCSFDRGTLNSIRALREAAIAQHSVEQSLVGSQRAHFSPYLQALVEVVAGLDVGPVQDFAMMSRQELMRAIETVDGLPGTALCRAVLAGI